MLWTTAEILMLPRGRCSARLPTCATCSSCTTTCTSATCTGTVAGGPAVGQSDAWRRLHSLIPGRVGCRLQNTGQLHITRPGFFSGARIRIPKNISLNQRFSIFFKRRPIFAIVRLPATPIVSVASCRLKKRAMNKQNNCIYNVLQIEF